MSIFKSASRASARRVHPFTLAGSADAGQSNSRLRQGATLLVLLTAGLTALPVQAADCPCDYSGWVKSRELRGAVMFCETIEVTKQGSSGPLVGTMVKQNIFRAEKLDRKGQVSKVYQFSLHEQALPEPSTYAPACQFTVVRSGKLFKSEIHLVQPADYEACALDLTAFAFQQLTQGELWTSMPCDDLDVNGIEDDFEPLEPTDIINLN